MFFRVLRSLCTGLCSAARKTSRCTPVPAPQTTATRTSGSTKILANPCTASTSGLATLSTLPSDSVFLGVNYFANIPLAIWPVAKRSNEISLRRGGLLSFVLFGRRSQYHFTNTHHYLIPSVSHGTASNRVMVIVLQMTNCELLA